MIKCGLQIFYAPLLKMLTEKELDGVFANIEEILLCNTVRNCIASLIRLSWCSFPLQTFLSSLEDRQKESRLYIDTVADLIVSHAPNFEIYAVCLIRPFPGGRLTIVLAELLCWTRPSHQATSHTEAISTGTRCSSDGKDAIGVFWSVHW